MTSPMIRHLQGDLAVLEAHLVIIEAELVDARKIMDCFPETMAFYESSLLDEAQEIAQAKRDITITIGVLGENWVQ